jgi:eukaryotic-like serine/threonine-protein kinase
MSEAAPKNFGRYQVLGVLGRGSMGVVYKAKDPVIGRLLAVKSVPETLGLDTGKKQEYIKRLLQEAKAAGNLQHPNIVTIFDAGESELGPFIAMEYLDGVTLKEVLTSGKRLSVPQLVELVRQVGEGLDYVHQRNIVHRDIKPANLMIVENNLIKIMDLGIARLPFSDLTREGRLVGSPSYMSPEQLQGEQLDGRSDLFSLAIVVYQAATGKKPFPGQNIQEICWRIIHDEWVPVRELEPSLPKEFEDLLRKSLLKDRAKRFQTGKEFFEAMRKLMGGKATAPVREKPAPEPETKPVEKETATKVSVQTAEAPSIYDDSSSLSTSSESEIDDIFRDLTMSHRSLKLHEDQGKSKTWQIALAAAFGLGIIATIIWFLIRG